MGIKMICCAGGRCSGTCFVLAIRHFPKLPSTLIYSFFCMLLSPARQGPRLIRLGVLWPTWLAYTRQLSFLVLGSNLWSGTGLYWIKRHNKRTRGLPVSLHQGGGFFCSSLVYEIPFVSVVVFCKVVVVSFCTCLCCMRIDRERAHLIRVFETICLFIVSILLVRAIRSSGARSPFFQHLYQRLPTLNTRS
jgi:hypothetical protein